jgi:beta-lactamase class A
MSPKSPLVCLTAATACVVTAVTGCSAIGTSHASTDDPTVAQSAPAPSASPSPSSPAVTPTSSATITAAIRKYMATRSGQASVSIKDLTTGATYSYNTSLRVATASIVKADILACLLLQAQTAGRHLTASEKALATKMIENSDNNAASALWTKIGRHAGMVAANKKLGLTQTIPGSGTTWGLTTTSAADQVRLLTALTSSKSKLSAASRSYELDLMSDVERDQRWGVSAAATAADTTSLQLKNGWMPQTAYQNRWTINSIGQVKTDGHDYLIGVLSRKNASMADGISTIQHLVKLAVKAVKS